MATGPILAAFDLAIVQRGRSVRSSVLSDYWSLTKPEVNFLIALQPGCISRLRLAANSSVPQALRVTERKPTRPGQGVVKSA